MPRTQIDYENLMTGIRSVKPDYKPKYRVHEDGEKFYRHSIYIWTVRPATFSYWFIHRLCAQNGIRMSFWPRAPLISNLSGSHQAVMHVVVVGHSEGFQGWLGVGERVYWAAGYIQQLEALLASNSGICWWVSTV